MVYSLLFTAYLIENKSTEINAYWELLIQRFFAAKLVYWAFWGDEKQAPMSQKYF